MEEVADEFGAKTETIVFLKYFNEMADPRQCGKVLYPLDEILLSMAETNCAKWRRESVPVGLREKGYEAPVNFLLPCRFMFWW